MKSISGWLLLSLAVGCGGGDGQKPGGAGSSTPIALPRMYPSVRAATPSALIADPTYASRRTGETAARFTTTARPMLNLPGAFGLDVVPPLNFAPGINLATVVQQRLYSQGPTSLLRIVKAIDDRTTALDTRPSQHPCLTAAPVAHSITLPGGQSFSMKLQCLQRLGDGNGWLAFGFAEALAVPDAGADDAGAGEKVDGGGKPPSGDEMDSGRGVAATEGGGDDFYLIEGQGNGMGAAYHLDRKSGNIEGWIAVADKTAPNGSQVIMHMLTNKAAETLELVFAGSGVGFCSAHLKTSPSHIVISGKTNAPPPPGTPMSMTDQFCDSVRTGCFAAADLNAEVPATDAACAPLAPGSFAIAGTLDASSDAGANVTPSQIHTFFAATPTGVAAF